MSQKILFVDGVFTSEALRLKDLTVQRRSRGLSRKDGTPGRAKYSNYSHDTQTKY